jgi:cellulose synthase (UDP-forming)
MVTAAYLTWRVGWTIDPAVPWLSVALVVLEIHAALGLVLFTFSLWDVDRRPASRDVTRSKGRIAVLLPTYNEGLEVLTPTIAAAVAMRLSHETWVLDDGDRPDVATLARSLGARYLTRPTHEHAKAGNLNHALGLIEADFIAVLDADHVAEPDFLVRTLGYFDDPRVALVQTPQEFYNTDSFEHEASDGRTPAGGDGTASAGADAQRFHEQTLFYRVLQPGKNRWAAAFWCGTGAVVRVAALREVGGVATDTITEDIHTTIRFHRRGWKTVYHNEVLARGLAASDAETYQLQRLRWGTGAMQVLRVENPLFASGLSVRQRLAYAATLLGWFDAWRSLGYLLLPIAVVTTGAVPIRAEPAVFLAAFGTTFFLQQIALKVLSRGAHRPILSIVFELVRMAPNLLATTTLLTRRRATFRVTPKGRTGSARRPIHEPVLLRAVAFLSVAGAAWYAATLMGATPTRYEVPWAAHATFAWLSVNVVLLIRAIQRIRSMRFAAERRAAFRFETAFDGRLGGLPCHVTDVSLTGARVEMPGLVSGMVHQVLVIDLEDGEVHLDTAVRSRRLSDGGILCGLEFLPGQHVARARLSLALFHDERIVREREGERERERARRRRRKSARPTDAEAPVAA